MNQAKVIKVIDGDTIEVYYFEVIKFKEYGLEMTIKSDPRRIRIKGCDTPETYEDGYQEAKDFTRKFCIGKVIDVEYVEKDNFGRDLAYVRIDGVDLTEELIEKGFARRWID